MGQPGRNPRRAAERALDQVHHIKAEIVDLADRRRKRDGLRHFRSKLYPEHFLIAGIVLASYVVAVIALL
jgi:hypothetical protein